MKYKQVGSVLKLMEDNNVVSLRDFKEAKVHLENLNHIKHVLDLGINALKHFQVYTPAYDTTYYLEGQRIIVEAYIKKFSKVVKKEKK